MSAKCFLLNMNGGSRALPEALQAAKTEIISGPARGINLFATFPFEPMILPLLTYVGNPDLSQF